MTMNAINCGSETQLRFVAVETSKSVEAQNTSYATIAHMHIWGAIDKNYCDTASSSYKIDSTHHDFYWGVYDIDD